MVLEKGMNFGSDKLFSNSGSAIHQLRGLGASLKPPWSSACALRWQSPSPGCCHQILRKCQGGAQQGASPPPGSVPPPPGPCPSEFSTLSRPSLLSVASNNTPMVSWFLGPKRAVSAGLAQGSGVRRWQNSLPLGCRPEVPLSCWLRGRRWGGVGEKGAPSSPKSPGGLASWPFHGPAHLQALYTLSLRLQEGTALCCDLACHSTSLCLGASLQNGGPDSTHFPGVPRAAAALPRLSCSPGPRARRGQCGEGQGEGCRQCPTSPLPPQPRAGPTL